jgi:hypothetical protein
MLKAEIKPGLQYAVREKREPGTPFQRVRILEHIRGNKWKAEWIEPNPGLIDYVESGQLIVPWKQRRPFLEEENEKRLQDHNERCALDLARKFCAAERGGSREYWGDRARVVTEGEVPGKIALLT